MDAFVERVSENTDIVRIVQSYVPLKRRGNRYWGCCPFHHEKTASFSVVPDKGFFYCFGCHAGGNAFKFISLIENISYFDAIKLQAEKLGIPLPERKRSPQEIAREREIQDLRKVNELARDFFHNCLTMTRMGERGKAYFAGRGIRQETIEEFQLGYAPPAWDKLSTAFLKRGIKQEFLLASGLSAERKQGSGLYDRFRGRVIIPIADERGRVVGFGGRVLDDSTPKYLNTPETVLFNKRKLLFGLDRSHRAIQQEGRAIVVEGYMDAISVFDAGVHNVVASLGTSFTPEHAKKLLHYAPEICFCYDSDEAGQKATIRALTIVRDTGARVRVIVVPDGKDPDEYMRDYGPQAYSDAMNEAQWGADYLINGELSRPAQTDEDKARIAFSASQYARANAFDTLELEMYLRRISNATGYSLEALYRNVGVESNAGIRSLTQETVAPEQIKKEPVSRGSAPATERLLLRLLCEHPFLCKAAVQDDLAAMFSEGFRKELLGDIIGAVNAGEKPNAQSLAMKYVEDGDKSKEIGAVFVDGTDFVDPSAYYRQCITTLRKDALIKARAEAKERLDAYVRQGALRH